LSKKLQKHHQYLVSSYKTLR